MLLRFLPLITLTVIFTLEGYYPFFKDRQHRLNHALPNVLVTLLNTVITAFLFAGITLLLIRWSEDLRFGLLYLIDLPLFLRGILALLLFDLWMYLWHVLLHKSIFLWRFHRMHHSDLEMDVTTTMRFHPGEILISSILRLCIIPLIGMTFSEFFLYNLVLAPVIQFHHSNIALPEKIDRLIRTVVVTPNMHRVHHSIEWQETNSNYSSIFSFWDRLFKTFRRKSNTGTIVFGLRILRDQKWQTIGGLLKTPFRYEQE